MKGNKLAVVLGGTALLAVVLWFAGAFSTDGIAPGHVDGQAKNPKPQSTVIAKRASVTEFFEAVGTVRPRTETRIESQVSGKVRKVRVKAGDFVKRGEVLIELDNRELAARRARAAEALATARAGRDQAKQGTSETDAGFVEAKAQYERIYKLFKQKAVSQQEMDRAKATYRQAEARLLQSKEAVTGASAGIRQAQRALEEADIALGYAVIRAPEDMEVARRMVEPGDLAVPGKPLLVVQTAGSLRLEAHVREGLISVVRPGVELDVTIPALETQVTGVVEEVVPSADTTTRTFLVKVGMPELLGAYPGMFGRLLVPAGEREAVMVAREAVRLVGQLATVDVVSGESVESVFVKTGEVRGERVEILSGLAGGEVLGVANAQ